MHHLSATDLKQRLDENEEQPLLLDVREPWEFALCNIEGSSLVPMTKITHAINDFNREQAIVVVCHTGVRSRSVCMFLEREGFHNVSNLEGGVHAWAMDVDDTMPTY